MFVSARDIDLPPFAFVKKFEAASVNFPDDDKLDLDTPEDRVVCMYESATQLALNKGVVVRGTDGQGNNFYAATDSGGDPFVVVSTPDGYIRLHIQY